MTENQELLKIGRFAQLAGTNLRTLRYYEELGLIAPAERSSGGFRYYRPTDINRVRLIRDLQHLGLNLEKVRELLGSRLESESKEALSKRIQQALHEHEALLRSRLLALEAQRRKIRDAVEKLETCARCQNVPTSNNIS